MGFFDSVTSFLGDTISKGVQAIAPGFDWSPSAILEGVESLLPVVVEAIPGVGPLLSHAVPAISAIFGGSKKTGSDGYNPTEQAVLLDTSQIKEMIGQSLTAITATRQELSLKIEKLSLQFADLSHQMVDLQLVNTFDGFVQKITPAIKYLNDEAGDLAKVTPFGGDDRLKRYITPDSSDTRLVTYHGELYDAVQNLQNHLTTHVPTQALLDLYILAVVWLLTYDKTILNLRAYLGQFYLLNGTMTNYVLCISTWNADYKDMQKHAKSASEFILGTKTNPGFIAELRKKRSDSILDIDTSSADAAKFNDAYPKYGVGSVGTGSNAALSDVLKTKREGNDQFGNLMLTANLAYRLVNMSYFDVATSAALDVAQVWQKSLYRWQARLPLSPPLDETGKKLVTATPVSIKNIPSDLKVVGRGWPTGAIVRYGVSYVTTYGEGFLSVWSDPVKVKKGQFLQLSIKPAKFPANAFLDKYPKEPGNTMGVVSVEQRVYVISSFADKTSTYHVGTVKEGEGDKILWDQAEGEFPADNTELDSDEEDES